MVTAKFHLVDQLDPVTKDTKPVEFLRIINPFSPEHVIDRPATPADRETWFREYAEFKQQLP